MRFCLAAMAAPGTDIVLSDDRLASARNFANKIWNASRFVFGNLEKADLGGASLEELAGTEVRPKAPATGRGAVSLIDWVPFAVVASASRSVDEGVPNYRIPEAAQGGYQV